MRASTEPPDSAAHEPPPLGPLWRREAASAQESVLPSGKFTVSCSAPVGTGGLGRHLEEVVDALARRGQPTVCLCASTRAVASTAAGQPFRRRLGFPSQAAVLAALPVPVSLAARTRAFMTGFDAYAAQRLTSSEHLIAFNGQALKQFRAATRLGYESVALISANSHLRHVIRQHARARRQYPLEGSWADYLVKRNLAEYARADRIYVGSRYTRESFLEEGFPDEKLFLFPFTPDPRYRPSPTPSASTTFDVVYIGSLSVAKGVPLLIDAVRGIAHDDIRLRLVGGWGTRGMRRFLQQACAADSRISVCPGDPLPHLHAARLCVHPSYEDGFGYAPAEALACGVPVIVSEDSGMKDLIDSPRTGLILPTGDLSALTEAIEGAYHGQLFASRDPA
jgi:glycosyltransferase involved in cell wall biosynthesis